MAISFTKTLKFLTFVYLFVCFCLKVVYNEKCRVLALEAGGAKGAWEAGVLKGFTDLLPADLVKYDVVSGVSAGTLNSLGIALFAPGEEKLASEFVVNLWLNINGTSDILTSWSDVPVIGPVIGPVWGLFYGKSLFNSQPLRNMLTNLSKGKSIKRDYVFGATSIYTGNYIKFQNLTTDELVTAAMASSAFPGIFPPVDFRNESLVDGGVNFFFDLRSPIKECIDKGFQQKDIEVDLFMCSVTEKRKLKPDFKTIDVILQSLGTIFENFKERDLVSAMTAYPDVKFRYIVKPSEDISDGIPIFFNPAQIRKMVDLGIKDAKNTIKSGEEFTFREVLKQYKIQISEEKKKIEKELETLKDY